MPKESCLALKKMLAISELWLYILSRNEWRGITGMPADSLKIHCNHFLKGIKMPKLKTKSAAKKRFGVTGTGKLKRNFAFKRHLLFNKGTKMKRQARGTLLLADVDVKIVKKFLPYL